MRAIAKAKTGAVLLALVLLSGLGAGSALGQDAQVEHTVYAPVYQKVTMDDRGRELTLTTELSVRNTDPRQAIELLSVALYDSQGRLVKQYLAKPRKLGPLAVQRTPAQYMKGQHGGSFLVGWRGPAGVNPPLVQTIMLGTVGQQGISLMSRGIAVKTPAK
jgi:Protein of unknown function (DUF3124)